LADWQEFERISVSTEHVEEVTKLLLRYATSEMTLVHLAASIRLLCEDFSGGASGNAKKYPRLRGRRASTTEL
jgi:hypothetical protein